MDILLADHTLTLVLHFLFRSIPLFLFKSGERKEEKYWWASGTGAYAPHQSATRGELHSQPQGQMKLIRAIITLNGILTVPIFIL